MTPEKKVQNKIIDYLKSIDCFYERRQAGGFNYKKGIPDLYCIINGKHIEIEVKKPGGKMSSMQYKQKKILEKSGAIYILAEDVNQVKEKIEAIKKSTINS